jgi:hypothetical protein
MSHNWEVFISHASEDKEAVARPLANHLAALGVRVWLDESELRLGDSLRAAIDAGLSQSRYGVVILSPNFFAKNWTKAELDGLFAKEAEGNKAILPIWHNVSHDQVRGQSPILAGRFAIDTNKGLANVAKAIVKVIDADGQRVRAGRPIFAGRLTKKQLHELPEGSFLLSNIYNPDTTPKFAEELPPAAEREKLWARLSKEGISNTKCYVFEDASAYRAHMSSRDIFLPIGVSQHLKTLPFDFDLEVVRALVAAGKSPPEAWRPFVTALSFDDDKYRLKNIDGLRTLTQLERLDLYDVEPINLEPLSELQNLKLVLDAAF